MDVFKPINFTKSDAMVQTNFDLLNNDVKIEELKKVLRKSKLSNNKDYIKMMIVDDSYKDLIYQILEIPM